MLNTQARAAPSTNPKAAQKKGAINAIIISPSSMALPVALEPPRTAKRNAKNGTNKTATPPWSSAEHAATKVTLTGLTFFMDTFPIFWEATLAGQVVSFRKCPIRSAHQNKTHHRDTEARKIQATKTRIARELPQMNAEIRRSGQEVSSEREKRSALLTIRFVPRRRIWSLIFSMPPCLRGGFVLLRLRRAELRVLLRTALEPKLLLFCGKRVLR